MKIYGDIYSGNCYKIRLLLTQLKPLLARDARLAWATKGFEPGSGRFLHEVAGRKILLFNPGSPTDRRYAPHYGLGILRIDGTQLDPELITW